MERGRLAFGAGRGRVRCPALLFFLPFFWSPRYGPALVWVKRFCAPFLPLSLSIHADERVGRAVNCMGVSG